LVANNLNAALVLLAQYDSKEEKLKYSAAILANAHIVFAWNNTEKEKESGIVEVHQLKSRNAETYPFLLQRDFSVMSFYDYNAIGSNINNAETAQGQAVAQKIIPKMPELNG
jgi:hypothetical protein